MAANIIESARAFWKFPASLWTNYKPNPPTFGEKSSATPGWKQRSRCASAGGIPNRLDQPAQTCSGKIEALDGKPILLDFQA
ncbi:MAG: hypothetical protein V1797_10220 [Pseudomonadota bacterium]